jgi:hypothetical protein
MQLFSNLIENEAHEMLVLINAKSIRLPRVLPALMAAPSQRAHWSVQDTRCCIVRPVRIDIRTDFW